MVAFVFCNVVHILTYNSYFCVISKKRSRIQCHLVGEGSIRTLETFNAMLGGYLRIMCLAVTGTLVKDNIFGNIENKLSN